MKQIQYKLKITIQIILACLILSSSFIQADETIDSMTLRIALDKIFPGRIPDSLSKSELPGIYEVRYGTYIFYFNKDASLMLQGDLIDTRKNVNLTEKKRSGSRIALIEAIGEDNMIVYPAKNEKYKVTVFTDVYCGYCVKLHRSIKNYNDLGITIRYMAYPVMSDKSYDTLVSIWCSKDRNQAMSDAKNGKQIEKNTCTNPVAQQLALGKKLGVSGTPAIFLSDGSLLPGYVEASRLKDKLDEWFK
jgi:thiol:disulfide interchange protein DsbC